MARTEFVAAADLNADFGAVRKAAGVLKRGGTVAIPTETVYGIAANALDPAAVGKIFEAKGRPQDNPLIVHVASLEEIEPLVTDFPAAAKKLAAEFWPGPLTIVLPKSGLVPGEVSAGLPTVAIRMPSHPIARAIIKTCGLPLAAPSANRSGGPSPTTARHCLEDLDGRVDLIVDGGECSVGLESTVITLATSTPRLLRPGAVTIGSLRRVLGAVDVDPAIDGQLPEDEQPSSPGMKYKHYAPKTELTIVHGALERFIAFVGIRHGDSAALAFDGEQERLPVPCVCYGAESNASEQARRLFAALRELDALGLGYAFARAPDASGVGMAVYNRLLRAAAFREIYL